MSIKHVNSLVFLAAIGGPVAAQDCNVTIDSTDAMRFDKSEISISKTCKEFVVHLTHSGKLAENVMGHNVVITKEEDAKAVANDAIAAGLDNDYVKPNDDRVIAFTEIIGGGEKTSVSFKVDKFKEGEQYAFFCSFPGHMALMKGKVTLI